ncbi:hypothetical protein DVH05_001841, partial [Phytophthora capsici]
MGPNCPALATIEWWLRWARRHLKRSVVITEGPLRSSCQTTQDHHGRRELDSGGRTESSLENLPGRRKADSVAQKNLPGRRKVDSADCGTGHGSKQTAWHWTTERKARSGRTVTERKRTDWRS